MSDIHALPFDQYQRYRLVADLLEKVLGNQGARILDVGGRTNLLHQFLGKHEIAIVDVESSDVEGLILGSGAALPFANDSFDAVCAFDTLEHVPVELRDAFVSECARVSRNLVFLAGPYHSEEVARSEELLQLFLRHKIGQPHRYLAEHLELGLPDRSRVTRLLEEAGGKVEAVGHANLERWLLAMCLEMYMESDPLLQPLAKPFYRFYNRMVYPHDHGGAVYRHVVMASFAGATLPTADDVLQAPELPVETKSMLQSMAADWMAVDRERQVWKPELERLADIILDLEKDLHEHKQTLQLSESDLAAHKQSLETCEVDLVQHKRSLETSEADLSSHKETLEAVRCEHQELKEVSASQLHGLNLQIQAHGEQSQHLQRALNEHIEGSQNALADLRSHYEGAMESFRLEGEAVQQDLGAELKRVQEHATGLEAERERAQGCIEALKEERNSAQHLAQGMGVQVQQLVDEIHTWEGKCGGLDDDIQGLKERNLKAEEVNRVLEAKAETLEAKAETLETKAEALEDDVSTLTSNLEQVQGQLQVAKKSLLSWTGALGRVFGRKRQG